MYFAIFKSQANKVEICALISSIEELSVCDAFVLTRVIVVGLGTSALIRETNVKGGEVLWQKCSQTEMFLRAGIVLWQNWGECCPSRRVGQTPVVHATDPYYHLTYDHITPVARRLRFIGDKGSDKKAYPSNYPAGVLHRRLSHQNGKVVPPGQWIRIRQQVNIFWAKTGRVWIGLGSKWPKCKCFYFGGLFLAPGDGQDGLTGVQNASTLCACVCVGHIHIMCYGSGPLKDL